MEIEVPLSITIGDGTEVTVGDLCKYYSSTNKKWMNSCVVSIQADTTMQRRRKVDNDQEWEWRPVTEIKAWLGKNLRPHATKERAWHHGGTITYHEFKNIRSWDGV